MKKVSLLIVTVLAILFSGCGSKQPAIQIYEKQVDNNLTSIRIDNTSSKDIDVVSPAQNLATMFYKAAKIMKEKNVKEFILDSSSGVPPMINNFDNLISYCYPENGGNTADDWNNKSSSLENKCSSLYLFPREYNNKMKLLLIIKKDKEFLVPHWKVSEILENSNIKEMITNVRKNLKEEDSFDNIVFEHKITYVEDGTIEIDNLIE